MFFSPFSPDSLVSVIWLIFDDIERFIFLHIFALSLDENLKIILDVKYKLSKYIRRITDLG